MRQRLTKKPAEQQIKQPEVKVPKEEMIKKQLCTIEDTIINKLQNSQLVLPKTKIPYLSQKQKQVQGNMAYQKLLAQKKRMQQKIKQLQNTEKIYLNKSKITQKSRVGSSISKIEMSEEDREHLKKLKKKLKDFQKSIQKKDRQIQQNYVKMKSDEYQRLLKLRTAANDLKKLKIEQKLQLIKQKKLQRQAQKQTEDSVIKKIQQKKKLYQLLDENWRQKNNQQQQRKYEIMQLRLKQKHVDFAGLKQHEKKYDQIIMDKKRQLREKRLSSSRQSHNSSFSGSTSKYYTLVLKQQKEAKEQQQKKKQRPKLVHQKRLQYAAFIREEFAPKAKTESDQQQSRQKQDKQKQPKIVRLTKQQIKQIGNINLIKGNKRAKKKQNKQGSKTIQLIQHKQQSRSTEKKGVVSTLGHYPDYLRQVRVKKQKQNHYSGFYNSPKLEAQKIMNSKDIRKEDKIARLKLLADRFDVSSTDIVAKIQGKLQILQVIN